MTLKERIENVLLKYEIAREESKVKMIESITEDFAIGFAEWVEYSCWKVESDKYLYEDDQLTTKELLEIYKKTL